MPGEVMVRRTGLGLGMGLGLGLGLGPGPDTCPQVNRFEQVEVAVTCARCTVDYCSVSNSVKCNIESLAKYPK